MLLLLLGVANYKKFQGKVSVKDFKVESNILLIIVGN